MSFVKAFLVVVAYLPFAVSLTGVCTLAQQGTGSRLLQTPERRVVFERSPATDMPVAHLDKSYLVSRILETTAPDTPNVWIYDHNGIKVAQAAIWIPEATHLLLTNAAVTSGGDIVVTGIAEQKDLTQAFFIALTDKTGKVLHLIRTNPFIPMNMCTAPDGTVWTAGGVRSQSKTERDAGSVIRHFDFSKGLIESYLAQSTFGSRSSPAGYSGSRREVYFACNANYVVLYSGVADQFVELTTSDHSTRRWVLDRSGYDLPLYGFALTENGDVYTVLRDVGSQSATDGLYHLEKNDSAATVHWMPVGNANVNEPSIDSFGYLYGADGELLVFCNNHDGRTLYWASTVVR